MERLARRRSLVHWTIERDAAGDALGMRGAIWRRMTMPTGLGFWNLNRFKGRRTEASAVIVALKPWDVG